MTATAGDSAAPAAATAATDEAAAAASAPSTSTSAGAGVIDITTDEYRNASAGLRATARWITSAFAALPGLAIVAALIKGPGTAGWNGWLLALGIALAAIGLVLGVYVFADVQRPGELTDDAISQSQIQRLPEAHGFTTMIDLRNALETARTALANAQMRASDSQGYAKADEKEASATDAVLKSLVDSASVTPNDRTLAGLIKDARAQVVEKRAAAAASGATAAIDTQAADAEAAPLAAYEGLRKAAYGLALADIVKRRFDSARKLGALAVLLVAGGIVCVALAPKEKAESKKSSPPLRLLYLTLNRTGIRALGCKPKPHQATLSASAIRVGGTKRAPRMITFASTTCPKAKEIIFATGPAPLGKARPASRNPKTVSGQTATTAPTVSGP